MLFTEAGGYICVCVCVYVCVCVWGGGGGSPCDLVTVIHFLVTIEQPDMLNISLHYEWIICCLNI